MKLNWKGKCESGHCLEWAHGENGEVHIRQSDNPETVITVTREEWSAFVTKVRSEW